MQQGDVTELTAGRIIMGKYFLAWLLGVPFTVLLLVYFLFHL